MSHTESEERRRLLDAQIDIVVDYLEESGVMVEFGGKVNGFFYEDDLIAISNRQPLLSRFYTLLHEAGHFVLRSRDDRFKNSVRSNRRKSKSKRVDVVHEEFLAWDMGLQLARELGLYVDADTWVNFSRRHLYDYIVWAHKPKEFRK